MFQILGLGREGEEGGAEGTDGELNPCFCVSEYILCVCVCVVAEIRKEKHTVEANAPHCNTKDIDHDDSNSLSDATWLQSHGPRPGHSFVGYVLSVKQRGKRTAHWGAISQGGKTEGPGDT